MIIEISTPHGIDPAWVEAAMFFVIGRAHQVSILGADDTAAKVRISMCKGDKPEHMPEALRRLSDALYDLLDRAYEVVGEVSGLPGAYRWLAAENGLAG